MPKEIISATIEEKTANKIRELAEKEIRSFSQMVDLLLQLGLPVFENKKKK